MVAAWMRRRDGKVADGELASVASSPDGPTGFSGRIHVHHSPETPMPRSILVPVLALLLLGAAPQQDGWDRDARRLVHLAGSRDGREGVRLERVIASGAMGDEGMRTVPVWLEAGREYLIVGVCDDECGDLDLRVHDTLGRPVAADEDALPRPMVDFTPKRGGEHAVRASMVSCGQTVCRYAVAVLAVEGW
jgi:hypothetical protein